MKEKHEEFVAEFRQKLRSIKVDLAIKGVEIDPDCEDLGVPIENIKDFLNSGTNATDCPDLVQFWKDNLFIMGDIMAKSDSWKSINPFQFCLVYKGQTISAFTFGESIYKHDVHGTFQDFGKTAADQFLLPAYVAMKFADGDKSMRDFMLGYFDFQRHRNWTIIWAKTDWVRSVFPKCYAKMMEDGQFLSVEELEEKMKEVMTS